MTQDAIYNINLMISTAILVIAFIFTVIFFREWRRQVRSKNEQYIPLALTFLYAFLFVGTTMMIYSNFFAGSALLTFLENTKVYFILVVGFIVIVMSMIIFIAERIVRKNTKHFFLIYFLIIAVVAVILKLRDVVLASILPGLNLLIAIPFLVLTGLFLYKLLWKTPGKFRQKMTIVIIGVGLFIFFTFHEIWFILNNEYTTLFGNKGALLLASVLMGLGFTSIPSFTEFDWAKKVRHLYILNSNGLCLFQQPFKAGSVTDEDLLGGSLMAVQSLMKEMIQSETLLQVIDHGDAKILFERSPHALCIMIADEDLYIVHNKLQRLLQDFEMLFGSMMDTWSGNLDLFKPLQPIVNKIFELK